MKNVNDGAPGTKPAAAVTLTSGQEHTVTRARRFLEAAAAGPRTLDAGTVEDATLFYAADGFGAARELLAGPLAVQAIYDSLRAAPGRSVIAERGHQLLEEACETVGVEVGAYDHRILVWLAGFEPQACAVIAGLIARGGHLAGLEVADIAIIRQALADASAWLTWRTRDDRDADIEQAAVYERLLRRLVSGGAR
jgi:hypothetical protein